jgi:xyloglucan-specific exo-beta-1,4-glucanase
MFHVQVIIKIGFIPYVFITPIKSKYSSGILLILSGLLVVLFSSAQAQTSNPYKWNSVFIGGGGFVSGLITSKEQPGLMYARTDVGGAYKWDAGTNAWLPLMDWVSERQKGILGTESLAIDLQSPNVIYISAGISYSNNGKSYILRSSDYGANFITTEVTDQFKIHGNGMGRQNGEKLQVDPNNSSIVYCGTRWNGLFRSMNFGSTWSRVKSLNVTTTANENGISFVVLDKASAAVGSATQRIFVGISRSGNNQNLYMSTNGGTDFSALVNPKLAADLMPQRAVLSGDGNLFITYGDGAGPHGDWVITTEDYTSGQIWKYNIASGVWTNVTPAGMNRSFSGISVDPTNPRRLVASTINTYLLQKGDVSGDRFFISTNGGKSWTDVVGCGFEMNPNGVTWIPGQSIHWAGCIEFDPSNPKKVWVTSGNGVFLNEDIDATPGVWKFSVKGLEETVPLNMVSIPDGPQISVIGDYDGFRHTDIEQYAPIHNPRMGTTTGLDYAVSNKNKVVRVGTSMYYSGDMGLTWTKTAVINGAKGQVALSADGKILLHSPDGSTISYRSANNGSSWTTISGLNFKNARPVADGANPNKFYAYNNGAALMMLSTDGGATFTAGGSPGNGGSRVIRTVPGKEGHIWVALYGKGLSRSVNSGATFTKLNNVTQCSAVGIGKAAPGSAYETIYIYGTVNGVIGVHRSIDEGASWVRVNDDKHGYGGPANGQFVVGDMNVYGRVYMSTAGRGIAVGAPVSKSELKHSGF